MDRAGDAPSEGRRRAFTRAGFLKAGGAALASVGAASVAQAAGAGSGGDSLAYLREASYEPLLKQTFRLDHAHGPIDATLVEVKHLGAARAKGEHFSLVFETRRAEPVPQGTYGLQHPDLGSFRLFLVPVGKAKKGYFLEAVINRMES